MGVTVDGQREAVADLSLLVDDLADLHEGYEQISDLAARAAAGFVNSRTGRLARTLRGTATAGHAAVTTTSPYGGPQNYGWPRRSIRPQHFLQKADQQVEPQAVAILQHEADHAIQRRGF